jgi:hypothetical protein
MRSEALPALLATAAPALTMLGMWMNGPAGYAFVGAAWLLSLVLLDHVCPGGDAAS